MRQEFESSENAKPPDLIERYVPPQANVDEAPTEKERRFRTAALIAAGDTAVLSMVNFAFVTASSQQLPTYGRLLGLAVAVVACWLVLVAILWVVVCCRRVGTGWVRIPIAVAGGVSSAIAIPYAQMLPVYLLAISCSMGTACRNFGAPVGATIIRIVQNSNFYDTPFWLLIAVTACILAGRPQRP